MRRLRPVRKTEDAASAVRQPLRQYPANVAPNRPRLQRRRSRDRRKPDNHHSPDNRLPDRVRFHRVSDKAAGISREIRRAPEVIRKDSSRL